MKRKQVLLTHSEIDREYFFTSEALQRLRQSCEVILNPHGRPPNDSELLSLAPDCEVILSEWLTGGGMELFRGNTALKAFVRCGVDMMHVDVDAATDYGVLVVSTSGQFATAVAEFTLGAVLALSRNLVSHHVKVKSGKMKFAYTFGIAKSHYAPEYPGFELRGQRLGLIGLGAIGHEVARLAKAFGMEVVATDPNVAEPPSGVAMVDMRELLETARVLSIHAAFTPRTRHLVGRNEFCQMRRDAFLINTARGGLIDTGALCEALREGMISGAAVDAYEDEPDFSASPLLECPNILLTPHMAGLTRETIVRQADRCVDIVEQILAGDIPSSVVNPAVKTGPNFRLRG